MQTQEALHYITILAKGINEYHSSYDTFFDILKLFENSTRGEITEHIKLARESTSSTPWFLMLVALNAINYNAKPHRFLEYMVDAVMLVDSHSVRKIMFRIMLDVTRDVGE